MQSKKLCCYSKILKNKLIPSIKVTSKLPKRVLNLKIRETGCKVVKDYQSKPKYNWKSRNSPSTAQRLIFHGNFVRTPPPPSSSLAFVATFFLLYDSFFFLPYHFFRAKSEFSSRAIHFSSSDRMIYGSFTARRRRESLSSTRCEPCSFFL